MGPQRLTIDLDGAWCYRAVHGLDDAGSAVGASDDDADGGAGGGAGDGAVGGADGGADGARDDDADGGGGGVDVDDPLLLQGLPRFLDLCDRLGARATLFVVGRDLDRSARYAALVAAAAGAGHDVESHSYAHHYDLSRRGVDAIGADLQRSIDAITRVTGRRPVGFRAPGYNLSPALLDAVRRAGFSWSSSLLPSPAYFAARALVIAKTALGGRRSASLLGAARDFAPGRGGRRRHDNGLLEFPMSAPFGVPLTGTLLALASDAFADAVVDRAVDAAGADPLLELHAADFVDGALLPPGQPDRDVRLADKLRRIERAARRVVRFAPAAR